MILSKVTKHAMSRVSASIHTSSAVQGSWKIPERLSGTADAENPGFFEMVEYYFHKAWWGYISDTILLEIQLSMFAVCWLRTI